MTRSPQLAASFSSTCGLVPRYAAKCHEAEIFGSATSRQLCELKYRSYQAPVTGKDDPVVVATLTPRAVKPSSRRSPAVRLCSGNPQSQILRLPRPPNSYVKRSLITLLP
jgi:hypothetical protein